VKALQKRHERAAIATRESMWTRAYILRLDPAEAAELAARDLSPGPYGRRTHHVRKAYGRFRKQVGVTERGADFHALRHTFTSMMEGAGVPLSTIQLLVGHSRKKTMGTTAVYTQGERVDLRKAIDRLRYSRAVMRLLAQKHVDDEVSRGRSLGN
jgi:integrase